MSRLSSWIIKEESGQGMVEYGLIIALTSLVAVATVKATGVSTKELYAPIKEKINEIAELITNS